MSRPCFALSVMLCCMGGPLLIIGKTQAQDTAVSPSHDPGECIVCPLAHGPLEPCGGYSDYDYNNYWYDSYSAPASEATPPTDPELEVAQLPNDGATGDQFVTGGIQIMEFEAAPSPSEGTADEAWESDYEDYYADYVYGDDTASADTEDLTLDETPAPAALVDPASEAAATPAEPLCEGYAEQYDEYGWYTDDAGACGDYFDSYDNYEPIETAAPRAASPDEATAAEADIDYEAYEEEWFSYGAEEAVEVPEVNEAADEAYEALSESANESWGDEETWYREEYGYDCALDEGVDETIQALDQAEELETGYDEAYDAAMAKDLEAAELAEDSVPVTPVAESTEASDYESFYDAYDDLYNFESTPAQSFESETSEATPAVEQSVREATDAEPAWLTELVDRILDNVWTTVDATVLSASGLDRDSRKAIYVDECAQEWDCEADYWAQPEAEDPSVVLSAANALDGMAAALQDAAEFLRGIEGGHGSAGGHLGETAQAPNGESAR